MRRRVKTPPFSFVHVSGPSAVALMGLDSCLCRAIGEHSMNAGAEEVKQLSNKFLPWNSPSLVPNGTSFLVFTSELQTIFAVD
jgi:hypothetical protein